jgi:hypothetical protein
MESNLAAMHGSIRRCSRSRRTTARPADGPDEFRYYLDRHGAQHFNFQQQLWIERSVAMAFTSVPTTALETLAINLLALACRAASGSGMQLGKPARLKPLAREFCEQCLLGAPPEGWVLPRPVIQAWLLARRR